MKVEVEKKVAQEKHITKEQVVVEVKRVVVEQWQKAEVMAVKACQLVEEKVVARCKAILEAEAKHKAEVKQQVRRWGWGWMSDHW